MPAAIKNPQADLDKIIAGLEKKFGQGTFHRGDESVPINHVPFVEAGLNYATEGGAPWGRFCAKYGDESSGKSLIAYELIAQAQNLPESAEVVLIPRIAYHSALADDTSLTDIVRSKHLMAVERLSAELDWIRETFPDGADAVFYNAEQQYDPKRAKELGIDTSRLRLFESTTIEEIVEGMENLYAHYPIHVVDSTSSASSLLSQKEAVGKSLMGTDARQWKACLRDSMRLFDPARNMGILIHQMSTNIRTGGSQAASSRYMRHSSSCSIRFQREKYLWLVDGVLKEDKPDGADKESLAGRAEPSGVEVFAKCEKSRTCRPFRVAGMQWSFKKLRFVSEHELASNGIYYGIITQKGSWYKVADEDQNIGQGLKTVYTRLEGDADLRERITCRLMDTVTDD